MQEARKEKACVRGKASECQGQVDCAWIYFVRRLPSACWGVARLFKLSPLADLGCGCKHLGFVCRVHVGVCVCGGGGVQIG
jgi:hypothetical protein